MKSDILYSADDVRVLPGDRVQFKKWFRTVPATVVFVPGLSKPHRDFPQNEVKEVGIRSEDGKVYGIVVYPESSRLRENVQFIERGEEIAIPDSIDDPFVEND